MDVNNIIAGAGQTAGSAYAAPAQAQETAQPAVKPEEDKAAVYTPSEKKGEAYKPDAAKIKQLMAESERQVENFRKLVEGLLGKQADKVQQALFGRDPMTFTRADFEMLEVDEATRLAAQKDIEEGGYYSVENTAARILDFAVALSGGDPSKIAVLREAVEKGLKMAENSWGGKLPEISYKTFDAVMKGFDEWEQAGSASAIKLLSKTE
ncbi:MAG: hypothetical protein FWE82_02810 [Defluviitaleaceae bacterium]|nr:hypothetical protein [Defluviitaleaceae bacterium]